MVLTVHTDGGSRGNPGPAATGVIITSNDELVFQSSNYIGVTTNNVAEYKAVIAALTWLQEHVSSLSPTRIDFLLDSLLVVSQINGVYQIKHPEMRLLKAQVDMVRNALPCPITFTHVRREQNKEADRLVNEALDTASS